MSGIANTIKDTLSSDNTDRTRTTQSATAPGSHTTPRTMGTHTATTGSTAPLGDSYTMSGGPAPKTDGPHKSDLMNKADPRVDSDRDHSKNMGLNPHGTADTDRDAYDSVRGNTTTTGGRGLTGAQTGTHIGPNDGPAFTGSSHTTSSGLREGATGPHSSRVANAADPRVDSDLDKSRTVGSGPGHTAGTHHTTAGAGGLSGNQKPLGHSSGLPEGTVGPHSSRTANAADPRVDSDLDNTRTTGGSRTAGGLTGSHHTTGTHTGTHTTHGSGLPEGTAGPHSSRAANAADPRVDSDLDNNRTTGASRTSGTTGSHHPTTTTGTTGHSSTLGASAPTTGPAPNTAGPHKSDMLNKLDPRVDSNLDGSKTVGGNKTFAGSNVDATHATR